MPFLRSLPEPAHLADLFTRFPGNVAPLMDYADGVLRGDGALSIGERELIATYVSALNACTFCTGSHRVYAEVFGIDGAVIDALVADPDTAPVDDRLRPVLAYVRKLNTLPSRMVQADVDAILEAGWSERAVVDAAQVSGLFNLMNRLIEGTGVDFDYADDPGRHPALGGRPEDHQHSYARFGAPFRAGADGDRT